MKHIYKYGRLAGMLAITAAAIVVMVVVSRGSNGANQQDIAPPEPAAAPKALVAIQRIEPRTVELYDERSGMIRPWERFTLGFETSGRVVEYTADEGDRVTKGQVLARIDDRILRARRSEAAARLELATSNLRRSQELKSRGIGAISDSDVQNDLTEVALAKAQYEVASKNLDDAVLIAPIDGRISRRMINAGETVNAHEPAFEIVETDRLILVLGIPESDIPAIEARRKEVLRNRKLRDHKVIDEQDLKLTVYVDLLAKGQFGKPLPTIEGTIHHVSETADDRTGLFEVEVELDNRSAALKPGMVARARIVTGRIRGYSVPSLSVIFRNNRASLFTVVPEKAQTEAMFFSVGDHSVYRAERVEIPDWIEQGDDILFPAAGHKLSAAIVRGQHRLVDGQLVEVTTAGGAELPEVESQISVGAKAAQP